MSLLLAIIWLANPWLAIYASWNLDKLLLMVAAQLYMPLPDGSQINIFLVIILPMKWLNTWSGEYITATFLSSSSHKEWYKLANSWLMMIKCISKLQLDTALPEE